jgi:hypothetical protein
MCQTPIQAQEADKGQKFIVHEDIVKPSMVAQYEAASKAFKEALDEHGSAEAKFLTVSLDDMRYLFVSPIENMAALDNNPLFKALKEALGEEGVETLMSGFDGTYETHKNYVLNLSNELSYNSGEIVEEGVYFRHFDYYFVNPDKEKEAKAISKEWKELYESHNIPQGYRIYTGGLGTEPLIMVVQWATSAEEFYAQQAKTREALGDVKDLESRTMAITRKFESHDGQIRPDLSYMPEAVMAEQ